MASLSPVYRFRHALIREATYSGLLRSQRRQLHARAAWDLEARSTDRLEEVAAVLGGHFAAAGKQDRAAHYLELAGDRAARMFANDEAIAQYRRVLVAIAPRAGLSGNSHTILSSSQTITAAVLCEKLTAKLTLLDRFAEARAAAVTGLSIVLSEETLHAARLQYVLGRVELQDNDFSAAEAAFEAAQKLMGPCGLDDDQERIDFWLWLQFDSGYLWHLRGDFERQSSILAHARPLAHARGSTMVVDHFTSQGVLQHLRERRYRVDALVLEEHRAMAEAAQVVQLDPWELRNVQTFRYHSLQSLGAVLAWHGDVTEAREAHLRALAGAERQGSPNARAIGLTELAITAWRAGDAEDVRRLVPQARALAAAGVNQAYVVAATAGLETWLAWHDGRGQEVIGLACRAIDLWGSQQESYPYFRCIPVFPLAGASWISAGPGRRLRRGACFSTPCTHSFPMSSKLLWSQPVSPGSGVSPKRRPDCLERL